MYKGLHPYFVATNMDVAACLILCRQRMTGVKAL
jgi:hypothetical protein